MRFEYGPHLWIYLADICPETVDTAIAQLAAALSAFVDEDGRPEAEIITLYPGEAAGLDDVPGWNAGGEIVGFHEVRFASAGITHWWNFQILGTKIPNLRANRFLVDPNIRDEAAELDWLEKALADSVVHYSTHFDLKGWPRFDVAKPEQFYFHFKTEKIQKVRRLAEMELWNGAASPIWPFPAGISQAITNRFGALPTRISTDLEAQIRFAKNLNQCVESTAPKDDVAALVNALGITEKEWFL